jgi:hypothetical protein
MASHTGNFTPGMLARWKGVMEFSREMPEEGRLTLPCVYMHFGAERLLYIGFTYYIGPRTKQHERDSRWFSQVDRIKVVEFDSADDAFEAEQVGIYIARPPYNVLGKSQDETRCVPPAPPPAPYWPTVVVP